MGYYELGGSAHFHANGRRRGRGDHKELGHEKDHLGGYGGEEVGFSFGSITKALKKAGKAVVRVGPPMLPFGRHHGTGKGWRTK